MERASFAVRSRWRPLTARKELPVDALWPCDGTHYPPQGVRGGANGVTARHWKVSANGSEEELPNVVITTIKKGEIVRGNTTSGGGYGNPLDRDPKRVLKDILDGFETLQRAADIYGVIFSGSLEDETLAVDLAATSQRRATLAKSAAARH